jgi:Flp pilus assembly protein TadG
MIRLLSDKRGAIVVEMAFSIPIMVMLMIGILQFALVLQASGAMRNAIGQGIRYAKVHPLEDPDDPSEVAALKGEVEAVAREGLAGVDKSGIKTLQYTTGTDANGIEYGTITMTYELKPLIPFATIPPIELTQTRTGYLPT